MTKTYPHGLNMLFIRTLGWNLSMPATAPTSALNPTKSRGVTDHLITSKHLTSPRRDRTTMSSSFEIFSRDWQNLPSWVKRTLHTEIEFVQISHSTFINPLFKTISRRRTPSDNIETSPTSSRRNITTIATSFETCRHHKQNLP